MSQNTKRVIVTGGCGYIGSHTVKELKLNGYETCIIDRVTRPHTLKYADKMVEADYASPEAIDAIAMFKPTAIIHCAGTSLVGPSVTNPGEYYENNVVKTVKLLDSIRLSGQKIPMVFSSSASVYGSPIQVPIPNTHGLLPMSPYGHTKAMIEQILRDYNKAYGQEYVALRYFNACGADLNCELGQELGASHIIARVLESMLLNQPFTLYGTDYETFDGTCIRDYVHVKDLAIAHVKAIDYIQAGYKSRSMNLGTNTGISNREIIEYVTKHYNKFEVQTGERRAGDPDTLIADATLAKQALNWVPQYSDLPTIITSAYNWTKKICI